MTYTLAEIEQMRKAFLNAKRMDTPLSDRFMDRLLFRLGRTPDNIQTVKWAILILERVMAALFLDRPEELKWIHEFRECIKFMKLYLRNHAKSG
jgi:hypothetical protein